MIPADVIVMQTSEENGICFVETMNLDGETNLKTRQAPKEVKGLKWDEINLLEIIYEAPNRYLY